jgi:hypothetical protein
VEIDNVVTLRRKFKFAKSVVPHPKTQAEFKGRVRSLSFSDVVTTVEWLNAMKGTGAQKRVLAVRLELEELGSMLISLRRQRQDAKAAGLGRKGPRNEQEIQGYVQRANLFNEFRERHNALNRTLTRYAFVPVLVYDINPGIWRFNAVPKATREPAIQVSDGNVTVQVTEASVIAALARLAANWELHKVRLCENCQERWLVSERQIDRFCSAKCRVTANEARPEFLDRKARNQKSYREREKRAHAEARVRVQRKKRK